VKTLEVPDHLFPALKRMVDTFVAKGQDYSTSDEAWASNFEATSQYLGIPKWEAADFNEVQKLARLSALRTRGRPPINEGVLDTYLDKAVYALIAYALILHHEPPGGDTFVQVSGPHSWSASPDGTGKSAP
jgi:hypothetical protein